jgi:hypothetical protein
MQYAGVPKAAAWFLSPLLELLPLTRQIARWLTNEMNLRLGSVR